MREKHDTHTRTHTEIHTYTHMYVNVLQVFGCARDTTALGTTRLHKRPPTMAGAVRSHAGSARVWRMCSTTSSVCVYTYIHTCIHTYMHAYIHAYIHKYIHTHTTHTHIHTHTY